MGLSANTVKRFTMALSGNTLGNLIKAAIDAIDDPGEGASESEVEAYRTAIFQAIGGAIVVHIQSSATIVGLVVTGVTGGPSTSGPNVGGVIV